MQEYADPVIDWLDAGRGILAKRLFREVSATSPESLGRWRLTHPILSSLVVYTIAERVLF